MLARRIDNPVDMLDREFGRVLGRLWGGGNAEVPSTLAPYAVDVHEDNDHFYVTAELPGFTKEDVEITLEDGVLTLHAERKSEMKTGGDGGRGGGNDKTPLHLERRWTRFERSFTLPTAVNENSVNATLNDGLLTITLDKREEVKPRKIKINAGNGGTASGTHAASRTQQGAAAGKPVQGAPGQAPLM